MYDYVKKALSMIIFHTTSNKTNIELHLNMFIPIMSVMSANYVMS